MSQQFINDFSKAIELTEKWELQSSSIFDITIQNADEDDALYRMIENAYAETIKHLEDVGLKRSRIRVSCATVSYIIHKKLELAGVMSSLITGDYFHTDNYMYETKELDLYNLLNDSSGHWPFHVWLILENGILIDPTRNIYLEREKFLNNEIIGKPYISLISELPPPLSYRPMLVGDDYLKRIDALIMPRNISCYCQSNKRFKHCCGKLQFRKGNVKG